MKLCVKFTCLLLWRGVVTVPKVHVPKLVKNHCPRAGLTQCGAQPAVSTALRIRLEIQIQKCGCGAQPPAVSQPLQAMLRQLRSKDQCSGVSKRALSSSLFLINTYGGEALDSQYVKCRMACMQCKQHSPFLHPEQTLRPKQVTLQPLLICHTCPGALPTW